LREFKENVAELSLDLKDLLKLKAVEYNWKNNGRHDLGFIAEEVEQVSPLLAEYNDGKLTGVKYRLLTALLTKGIQEQQELIDTQDKRIAALESARGENGVRIAAVQGDSRVEMLEEQLRAQQNEITNLKNLILQLDDKGPVITTKAQELSVFGINARSFFIALFAFFAMSFLPRMRRRK
jgi:hypothetical protein